MSRLGPKIHGGPVYRPAHDVAKVDRDHELKIIRRPEKLVGYSAGPAELVERHKLNGPRPTAAVIKQLEADCRTWANILRRVPLPAEYIRLKRSGQGARWFDMVHERGVDYEAFRDERGADGKVRAVHERPQLKPSLPTAAEISWMDRMDSVLTTLGVKTFAYMLVTGRANRISWAELGTRDPERRGERQHRRLHHEALTLLVPHWLTAIHKI